MSKLDPILQQLRLTLEEYSILQKTKEHFDIIEGQLARKHQERDELLSRLKKEEKDVDALEKQGVKTLFYNILGSKEQQLEKERQEYLDASLQYNTCQESIELLEFEHEILQDKVNNIAKTEAKVAKLKQLRVTEILSQNNATALKQELERVLDRLDDTVVKRSEHNEALEAGKRSLNELEIVVQHLRKAQDWGKWDMVDKRSNSSYLKYGAIDRARRHLPRAQMELNRFKKELLDVGIDNKSLVLQINEFSGFNTVFFDNIITDWILQQKLHKSISSIQATGNTIHESCRYLKDQIVALDNQYQQLILAKDEIILQG